MKGAPDDNATAARGRSEDDQVLGLRDSGPRGADERVSVPRADPLRRLVQLAGRPRPSIELRMLRLLQLAKRPRPSITLWSIQQHRRVCV